MANHCVLTTSRDFLDLYAKVGIHKDILAAKISIWQEQYGLDNYPTLNDLDLVYSLDKNKELYDKYNLINNKDSVKQISAGKSRDKWVAMLNNSPYKAVVKLTPDGEKIFLTDKGSNKSNNSSYQLTNEKDKLKLLSNEEITKKVTHWLSLMGISINSVLEIKDKFGNKISANAVARIMSKVIDVIDGKAKIDTLPEEAAHFFVELLEKDSPMYKFMYKEIIKYKIYDEVVAEYGTLYEGNEDMLRKEAIGKLIAMKIVKAETGIDLGTELKDSKSKDLFNAWWNKAWEYIKSLFKKIDKKEVQDLTDYFEEAGKSIMNGKTEGLSWDNITNFNDFYQLNPQAVKETKDKLNSVFERNGKWWRTNNKGETVEIPNITQKTYPKNPSYKSVHDAILNIIGVTVGNGVQEEHTGLNEVQYDILKKEINELISEYSPEDIFVNVPIYNEKTNSVEFVDTVFILPDGSIDIKNFETLQLENNNNKIVGEITFKDINKKGTILNTARNFFKSVGLKTRDLRIKPIHIKTGSKEIVSTFDKYAVEVNGIIYDKDNAGNYYKWTNNNREDSTKEEFDRANNNSDRKLVNLKQFVRNIVVNDETLIEIEFNKTDIEDKKLQELIKRLDIRLYKLLAIKSDSSQEAAERLAKSINKILVKKEFDSTVNEIIRTLNNHIKKLTNNPDLTDKDIRSANEAYTNYEAIKEILAGFSEEDVITDELVKKAVGDVNNLLSSLNRILIKLRTNRKDEVLEDNGILNKLDHQMNFGERWLKKLRTVSNKFIFTAFKIIDRQNEKVYNKVNELMEELAEWKDKLKNVDLVNALYNPETGNLIPKHDKEFYTQLDIAVKNKDIKWLEENLEIKTNAKENYEEYRLKRETEINSERFHPDDSINEQMKLRAIASFKNYYDIWSEDTKDKALLKQAEKLADNDNTYLKVPSEKWLSKEYEKLDTVTKEFYNWWGEKINYYGELIDEPLARNFFPKVQKSFIEGIANDGLAGIKNMFKTLDFRDEDYKTMSINEVTGEIDYQLPTYFLTSFENKAKQSTDIFSVMASFAFMAENYHFKEEIEDTVLLLKDALADEKVLIKLKGKYTETVDNKTNLEAFNTWLSYMIYDVKITDEDKNWLGKSRNKIIESTLDYLAKKALSMNLMSGIANEIGSRANIMFEAAKGNNFTSDDKWKAEKLLLGALTNKKTSGILHFFDLEKEALYWKKIKGLSLHKSVQWLTADKAFIVQRTSDRGIDNTILLAMMLHHTIDETGKIVKRTDYKTQKPLTELFEEKDDKLETDISDEEIYKFRHKVLRQIEIIKGVSSRKDISGAKQKLAGLAAFQFRNWIPSMYESRFGTLEYDYDNERWEQGRYLNGLKTIWQTKGKAALQNIVNIAYTKFNTEALRERAKRLYIKEIEKFKDTNIKISEEEFIEMYLEGVRANLVDARVTLLIMATILLIGGFSDDKRKKRKQTKAILKMLNRARNEINFFINPSSTLQIISSPIPSTKIYVDIIKFFDHSLGEVSGQITGDKAKIKKNAPVKDIKHLLPVINGGSATFDLLGITDEEKDK